ncbi:hypothetical protein T03_11355 [Trichinella britovi]|uniref:Uncharacterized protein n=1 Tax=Trichinella britovi TaxID=45882 RepID=A0A0V0Z4Z4_TRIBR|nr:hypothetical protein T03_11355 [Trichinella britovi]
MYKIIQRNIWKECGIAVEMILMRNSHIIKSD